MAKAKAPSVPKHVRVAIGKRADYALSRFGATATQAALATALKVTPDAISRLISGERLLGLGKMIECAKLLGVTLGWLLNDEGELGPAPPPNPAWADQRRRAS